MPHLPGARFSDPAELYDLLYHWKDYPAEAAVVAELLAAAGIGDGESVLEAACGTGARLAHLTPRFAISGFDLDPAMLDVARRRLPSGTPLFAADLHDWSAGPFGAVLLLFGGVGYIRPGRLVDVLSSIHRSVRPGGVLVLEPWVAPDVFRPDQPHMATYETRWLKVARQCVTRLEDGAAVLEFHTLVARPGFSVEHIVDTQRLWLRSAQELVDAAEGVGFAVTRSDRGAMPHQTLLICQRRL